MRVIHVIAGTQNDEKHPPCDEGIEDEIAKSPTRTRFIGAVQLTVARFESWRGSSLTGC